MAALAVIINALGPLTKDEQERVLNCVVAFFDVYIHSGSENQRAPSAD